MEFIMKFFAKSFYAQPIDESEKQTKMKDHIALKSNVLTAQSTTDDSSSLNKQTNDHTGAVREAIKRPFNAQITPSFSNEYYFKKHKQNYNETSEGNQQPSLSSDEVTRYKLSVTLKEILTGTTKSIELPRKIYRDSPFDLIYRREMQVFDLVIPKGTLYGTVLTLSKAGDIKPGTIAPVDISIVISPIGNEMFSRAANEVDLHTWKQITFEESITYALDLDIPTLDGGSIHKTIDKLITSDFSVCIVGQGLPYLDEPNRRGDLIVYFDIHYPNKMTQQDKVKLAKSLTG